MRRRRSARTTAASARSRPRRPVGLRARPQGSSSVSRLAFEAHRIIAQQKARISTLKAGGHATQGDEQLLEMLERRLWLLEEDERQLRAARDAS
jgi:hypothetical protein